ncbi:MAG TPA: hypothetical protein VLV83_01535 [Acidobacteriota bacterium]|nr:hypothetical protein [Acidobacteriota bacterium]
MPRTEPTANPARVPAWTPSGREADVVEEPSAQAAARIYARWLRGLLRFGGSVMLLAVGAVLMPAQWMNQVHQGLGLGHFPSEPITIYLARSASALYAIHGGVLWLASTDIGRFAPLIRYMAWAGCTFAVTIFFIDRASGMPGWWTVAESLQVLAINLAFLYLLRRYRQAAR